MTVAPVPIVAVIPLPQTVGVASVPGSLGAYDALLAGTLSPTTGTSVAGAAAVVLVMWMFELLASLGCGDVAAGFLRDVRA